MKSNPILDPIVPPPLNVVPDVPQTEHEQNIYFWKVSVSRGDDDMAKHYRKLIEAHRKAVARSSNLDPEATADVTDRDVLTDTPTVIPTEPTEPTEPSEPAEPSTRKNKRN
jgi:hypothetical protein